MYRPSGDQRGLAPDSTLPKGISSFVAPSAATVRVPVAVVTASADPSGVQRSGHVPPATSVVELIRAGNDQRRSASHRYCHRNQAQRTHRRRTRRCRWDSRRAPSACASMRDDAVSTSATFERVTTTIEAHRPKDRQRSRARQRPRRRGGAGVGVEQMHAGAAPLRAPHHPTSVTRDWPGAVLPGHLPEDHLPGVEPDVEQAVFGGQRVAAGEDVAHGHGACGGGRWRRGGG